MRNKVFISYSHKDEKYKTQLEVSLSSLKREGIIETWTDQMILPGNEWNGKIIEELEIANIILFLVSSDFIASTYCYEVEVQRAIEKHYNGESIVIPVILRPCDWKNTLFSKLQGLPKNVKPISKWDDSDDAYLSVVQGIRERVAFDNDKKNQIARSYEGLTETTKVKLEKFNYSRIEETTGLEDFVEILKDSKYHPTNLIPTITTEWVFMGHGASKWTKETELLDPAIQRILVNDGKVRVMVFDPRQTEVHYEKKKILKSIIVLKSLMLKYNLRDEKFFQLRVYNETPSFRLAFINRQIVTVGHYKTYTANSNDSPIVVFNSSRDWSFYSAFRLMFNEKWNRSDNVVDIWEDLLPIYREYKIDSTLLEI